MAANLEGVSTEHSGLVAGETETANIQTVGVVQLVYSDNSVLDNQYRCGNDRVLLDWKSHIHLDPSVGLTITHHVNSLDLER